MDDKEQKAYGKAADALRCHIALGLASEKLDAATKAYQGAVDALTAAKRELVLLAYDKTFIVGAYAVIVTTAVANGVLIQKATTRE